MATQKRSCSSFANFYGRLPVRDAYDIINRQNPGEYTFDSFIEYLKAYQRRRDCSGYEVEGFFFVFDPRDLEDWANGDIVGDCYETDCYGDPPDENKYDVLVLKDELLKYADDHYYARSPELTAVIEFVQKHKTY